MTSTTRVERTISASAAAVYAALVDGSAVQRWMVPDGMTSEVHEFDAVEGGRFRISLTYDEGSEGVGKTDDRADTFAGRFVRLQPEREVVQAIEFDSGDASMRGEMTITYRLTAVDPSTTIVHAVHEGVPPEDNELGWRMSMDKLAALVESDR